jgi:glucan phosphoethanolaminetransferase (alkaline phosphatase superfamily)
MTGSLARARSAPGAADGPIPLRYAAIDAADPVDHVMIGGARVVLSALLIPALCVGGDLAVRSSGISRHGLVYAIGALLSALVWGLALETARSPLRGIRAIALALIACIAALGVGLQAGVYTLTHAYLGRRALILALGIPNLGHTAYIAHNAFRLGAVIAIPAAVAVALAKVRTRWLGFRTSRAGAVTLAAMFVIVVVVLAPFDARGVQPIPPDVLFMNGVGGPLLYAAGLAQKPRALPVGSHEGLPRSASALFDGPPIVLILGESIRRDAVCSTPEASCTKTPHLDAVLPGRVGFERAFSVASCTELASTALWTGMSVTTDPDTLSRAPLLWDWAKARGYRTAYVTSQNLLFQQSDQFLRGSRIDFMREARDEIVSAPIDGGSPDEHTTPLALAFIEALGPPAFVVVHHANTHVPYRQVAGFTPFADDALGSYRNGLLYNDSVVADLVAGLRRGARGKDAIVLYLSDHGEAFEEHGVSYHSFDLYAEQVDVPMWIDAPPGSLPGVIMDRLRREGPTRPITTYDVSATVIDLMGGLDDPSFRVRASALSGTSLLREPPSARTVFLWNCPSTRECASESFGVVAYPRKLHYVGREARYACSELDADPAEREPRPERECTDLRALLDRTFGTRADAPGVGR